MTILHSRDGPSTMPTKPSLIAIAALCLTTATACGRGDLAADLESAHLPATAAQEDAARAAPARQADSPEDATYVGVYEHPVTLTDGVYQGEPFVEGGATRPVLRLGAGLRLQGDLDGDGRTETVVFLEDDPGGSGRFVYVAVLTPSEEGLVNPATASLGDRVQVRGARLEPPRIVVEVVEHGPGDAACCPSRTAVRQWRYSRQGMTEEQPEATGVLSPADLEGPEWVFAGFDDSTLAPTDRPVTLLVDGDKVAGFGGCNRYMGGVAAGRRPGEIRFGPLAGTMMACPEPQMEVEHRYLRALEQAQSFAFRTGSLVLSSTDATGNATRLRFEPHALEGPQR